ncbi:MAG: histidine--tRNA ligase [Planctomycetes bacterium]|nr:histidine--tRNA ligase [Planctomycetota bacterium]
MSHKRPEGTDDILPDQIPLWLRFEQIARGVFGRYGYLEVRPPLFEHTRLFLKTSGDTTDVVEKQMFTVPSRSEGEDSYTFRPELTPGVIRALIENGLFHKRPLWKVFYIGPMFRYEKPQKGRTRQFHQFGVEAVGSKEPLLDVETMAVLADVLREVGVKEFALQVNTLGCPDCREAYRGRVRQAMGERLLEYCESCRRRFERNVLRVFDCKVETCARLAESLPAIADFVCADCRAHFEKVLEGLRDAGLEYVINKRIVRGLDYYSRTVYEFTSTALGAQNALGGGGRYDSLVGGMGGPDVGAVGFAAGVERVLMAAKGVEAPAARPDFFVIAAGEEARRAVFRIAQQLRAAGLAGDLDYESRSVKAQMRRANDLRALYAVIVGPEELAKQQAKIKNMDDGVERVVALAEVAGLIGRARE